jgi:NhaP-type Na+/H+ or K+/H+ antiporter
MAVGDLAGAFLSLGVLFLLGLLTDLLGRRTPLPRVTLLILLGFLVGPSGFDLVPALVRGWFPGIGAIALTMVGFLLGGYLTRGRLAANGRFVLTISLVIVVVTVVVMALGLASLGFGVVPALLLAGVATSTDPVAIVDVVDEAGARGPFTDTLLGTVAVDDAWGLVAFSVLLAVAEALTRGTVGEVVIFGMQELGGALLLGVCTGLPMAFLTGRLRPGRPTLAEGLGFVFLTLGLAVSLGVSFLLAGMVMGTVVANVARHHERAFHEIEGVEWPFMILFFLLAGASLQMEALRAVGGLGVAYVVLRIAARLIAGPVGVRLGGARRAWGRPVGLAVMPQAGVAVGMALIAVDHFPELRDVILPVTIGATVLFELGGPICTRLALEQVDEVDAPA